MRKHVWMIAALVLMVVVAVAAQQPAARPRDDAGAAAQQPAAKPHDEAGAAEQQPEAKPQDDKERRSGGAYRVEYTMFEVADGKRSNVRSYSIVAVRNGRPGQMRIGGRMPVSTGGEKAPIHYLDVGARIDVRMREFRDAVEIDTNMEISSVAGASDSPASQPGTPFVRRLEYAGSSVITPGSKPVLLTSMEDAATGRRVQVEVTVTKLR